MSAIYAPLRDAGLSTTVLPYGQKAPPPQGWEQWCTAWPSDSLHQQWFPANDRRNVAVLCGPASGGTDVTGERMADGLIVLVFNDRGLYEAFTGGVAPDTWIAESVRGPHVYVRINGELPATTYWTARRTGSLTVLELRSTGAYVVAPRSRHPDGPFYEWAHQPTQIMVFDREDFDLWLGGGIAHASGRGWVLEHRSSQRAEPTSPDDEVITAGGRNVRLTALAGSMRRQGASEAVILASLRVINEQQVQPPLEDSELQAIAHSVAGYAPEPDTTSRVGEVTARAKAANGQVNVEEGIEDAHGADVDANKSWTDTGMAQRLVNLFGTDLRYDHTDRRWLVWRHGVWVADNGTMLVRHAQEVASRLLRVATRTSNETLKKFAYRSLNRQSVANAVVLAQADERVGVTLDDLDQHPYLLGVRNGTLDLSSVPIVLREPERDDLLTHQLALAYDPAASCPRWDRFLEEIFDDDEELIAFIQRAVGYTLTGDVSERVLFVLLGDGSNGKSLFLRILHQLLGSFAVVTPTETLLLRPGALYSIPNDIARLKGARLVTAIESDIDQRLNEARIKSLTGGTDTLTARFLHGEFFDFVPEFKLWLATNHMPTIRGRDQAIWDRLRIVPFNRRFIGQQREKALERRLRGELEGILRWAVDGCALWQADELGTCDAVERATAAHAEEMDQVQHFIDEVCTVGAGLSEESKALYDEYHKWCEASGETALSANAFGRQLTVKGFEPYKDTKSNRRWRGLMVR